jgi:hypothetical protein
MTRRRTSILYVGNVAPGNRGGGSIIIDRHLRHLAALGHEVSVLVPEGSPAPAEPVPWKQVVLPARQGGWPPFRPTLPFVCRLRSKLILAHLTRRGLARADQILTICAGALSWLAADLAQAWRSPLTAIVHDWWDESGSESDRLCGEYCCRHARNVLTVSSEMSDALAPIAGGRTEVLPPVSATRTLPFVTWREEFAHRPVIAHVGAFHLHHVPYLAAVADSLTELGGELLVICPAANPALARLRAQTSGLAHHDYFPTHQEALEFVSRRACAFTVTYPNARSSSGKLLTGFPSRFIEFSQLGLPALLAAPTDNPLHSWAVRQRWNCAFPPEDSAALRAALKQLVRQDGWEAFAADTRRAADTVFDPEATRQRLADLLSHP